MLVFVLILEEFLHKRNLSYISITVLVDLMIIIKRKEKKEKKNELKAMIFFFTKQPWIRRFRHTFMF